MTAAADVERIQLGTVEVVLATVISAEQAVPIARRIRRGGDAPYIGLVSADVGAELWAVLAAMAPVLAEVIFFDAESDFLPKGDELAMTALTNHGYGQDFVYTVATLSAAIDYAVQELRDKTGSWDGDQLLVIGPGAVTRRARLHLIRSI